jgi:hypothetical protein
LDSNQIVDISFLVANIGLAEGDKISLQNNPLSSLSLNTYITQPRNRGVTVEFDEGIGSISGTVRDQSTGLPLANVSVEANWLDGVGGNSTTTDENGNYTITGLPYGRYHVSSPARGRWGSGDDGYLTIYWPDAIGPPSPTPILILDSVHSHWTGINFSLKVG